MQAIAKSLFIFLLFSGTLVNLHAQKKNDAIETSASDSIVINAADSSMMKKHSPKKASLLSAIIPGAGQAYNGKYWKLPLIYGLGGTFVYMAIVSNRNYHLYRESLIVRLDSTAEGSDHFPELNNNGLQAEMERTQKNKELAIIGTALVYALQIVDAAVDAHLRHFDVSEDLSMLVKPKVYLPSVHQSMANGNIRPMMGLQINFRVK